MGIDELTDFMMAKSELPKSFSREEISALAGQLQIEEHPAGETLMREGTPACSLMLLISGEVRRMLGDVAPFGALIGLANPERPSTSLFPVKWSTDPSRSIGMSIGWMRWLPYVLPALKK